MEKYLAAILLAFGFSVNAQVVKGTIPIMCTSLESLAQTLEEYNEVPLLTGLSKRDTGDGTLWPFSMVIFANGETGTYTIAEKVENMYCVIGIGENLQPFVDKETQEPYKGT